jgi:hypothetical protein
MKAYIIYFRMAENYIAICGEVARGLSVDVRDKVQFLGGITALALGDPRVEIDMGRNEVEASADLYLSSRRDNGTTRDLDVLALTTDQDEIDQIETGIANLVDGRLEVSVFGLKPASILERQRKRPMGFSALKTFLSDRYINEEAGQHYRALFPFAVPVSPETVATWTLKIGEDELPMPAPGATILNYTQRSISGLRPKDATKWAKMLENLVTVSPATIADIERGNFANQAKLTGLIDSLRYDNLSRGGVWFGLERLSTEEMLHHEGFMLREIVSDDQRLARAVLEIARFKAAGLAFFERQEKIVAFWQEHIEPKIDFIVKNK